MPGQAPEVECLSMQFEGLNCSGMGVAIGSLANQVLCVSIPRGVGENDHLFPVLIPSKGDRPKGWKRSGPFGSTQVMTHIVTLARVHVMFLNVVWLF